MSRPTALEKSLTAELLSDQSLASKFLAQSIFTNTLIASVGRVINVLLGLIVVSLVSRYLGATQFGSYALLLSYGAIIQIIADLGLYLTLTRAISEHPAQENNYLSHIISIRLLLLLTFFSLGLVLTFFVASLHSLRIPYLILSFGFAAQSISQLFMGVFQKYGVVWRASIGDLLGRLTQLAGVLIIGTSATVSFIAGLFTAGSLVAYSTHRALLPSSASPRLRFSRPLWTKLIATSLPLGGILILNAIYFRLDIVLLSVYRSADQVGHYGLAYRIVESALFLPAMFGGLLLPHLSAAWQTGNLQLFRRYLNQALPVVLWAALFITFSLVFFANPLVALLGGVDYQAAGPLLRVLALSIGIMFIGNLFGFALVAGHKQQALLVLSASLAALNVILNIVTIPVWGALAAAWTTVITEAGAASIAAFLVWRLANFSLHLAAIFRISLALLFTLLIYQALPTAWPVVLSLLAGSLGYLAASWWLGLLRRSNFDLLFKAV